MPGSVNTIVAEFLIQKYILEQSNIFIGSQGSTVSVHVNYMNYIFGKPHEYVTISNCKTYDKIQLKHKCDKNKKCEFDHAAFGIIALESFIGAIGKSLEGKVSWERIIELISINPRRILNLEIPSIEEILHSVQICHK